MKNEHISATKSHYDSEADTYDSFNQEKSKVINNTILNILKKNNIKRVADFSCGTGSQVFFLHDHGIDMIGFDISEKMLSIAMKKCLEDYSQIKFFQGDMRNVKTDKTEVIITIFNSIGHLTKDDFEIALRNIYSNLSEEGLYIFDIFNLDYLLFGDNITTLTIDWITYTTSDSRIKQNRKLQYSTIDTNGILTSYNIEMQGENSYQTLQTYSLPQLENMLLQAGFKILQTTAIDGLEFSQYKTDRMLVIAKKL